MQQEERNPDLQLHQALVSGGDTESLQVYDAQLVLGSLEHGGWRDEEKREGSVTSSLDGRLAH